LSVNIGRRGLLLGACSALCRPLRAAEPGLDHIEWVLTEGDPTTQQILAPQMPDVPFTIRHANIKRIWKELLSGAPVCSSALYYRREYAASTYFTPTFVSAPPVVAVWPETVSSVPGSTRGVAQLPLLMHSGLKGAAISGRNYGDVVNAMIARRPGDSSLTLLESSGSSARGIEMLVQRRVEYLIVFASEFEEPNAPRQARVDRPRLLPIEGAEVMVRAGVVCPRTPWGLMAMRRLDAVLSTPTSVAQLRLAQDELLVPSDRKRYAAQVQDFFKARAHPMMQTVE